MKLIDRILKEFYGLISLKRERACISLFSFFFLLLPPPCFDCFAATSSTLTGTQRPYVINNKTYSPLPSAVGYEEVGTASWYGADFHGNFTSNGERYNMHGITAAHKVLPMNTVLLVTNLENGKEIVVRVNDRGPFVQGRIIDLSYGAAKKIALLHSGTARVKITALGETKVNRMSGKWRFAKYQDLKSGEYYVQIGAFLEKNNALSLQKRFHEYGHKVVIMEASIKGNTYNRVQVYVGNTLENAKRSEQTLRTKGYTGAFTIAR